MGEECKDCLQVKSIEDKIRSLWHVVGELKAHNKEIEKKADDQSEKFELRITGLERASDVTEEKFDRIFTAIGSIEKNIEKIANCIEQMRNKNANVYDNLKYEIVKYIVIAVVAVAVSKLM